MQIKNDIKIAVHLHLYYFEMWDEIKSYLENIGNYPYHLYITITNNNTHIIEKIKKFHKETTILNVANRGYDVGGFVYFLHTIDLKKYDIIIKIHTKNKKGCDTLMNHRYISRKDWFNLLYQGLLGSNTLFLKNLYKFNIEVDLGMIGSRYLITSNIKNIREVKSGVCNVMEKLGYKKPERITFVAGTMFMIRSHLLQKVKDNFTINDFDISDANVKDGTLAHILERVFGCLVIANGYKIKGYDKNNLFEYASIIRTIRNFIYYRKITKNNYMLVKVFKLPIYHRKQI